MYFIGQSILAIGVWHLFSLKVGGGWLSCFAWEKPVLLKKCVCRNLMAVKFCPTGTCERGTCLQLPSPGSYVSYASGFLSQNSFSHYILTSFECTGFTLTIFSVAHSKYEWNHSQLTIKLFSQRNLILGSGFQTLKNWTITGLQTVSWCVHLCFYPLQ